MGFLPPVKPSSSFLYWLKYGTLQYAIASPIMAILAVILHQFDVYGEGEWRWDAGYGYIVFMQNCTQIVSLYALVWLYTTMKNELRPFNPMSKFLVVKAVVFFTFWQSVLISILVHFSILKDTETLKVGDVQIGLQDLLVCIEMFVAACFHKYTFGVETYASGTIKTLMDARAQQIAQLTYERAVKEAQKRLELEKLERKRRRRMKRLARQALVQATGIDTQEINIKNKRKKKIKKLKNISQTNSKSQQLSKIQSNNQIDQINHNLSNIQQNSSNHQEKQTENQIIQLSNNQQLTSNTNLLSSNQSRKQQIQAQTLEIASQAFNTANLLTNNNLNQNNLMYNNFNQSNLQDNLSLKHKNTNPNRNLNTSTNKITITGGSNNSNYNETFYEENFDDNPPILFDENETGNDPNLMNLHLIQTVKAEIKLKDKLEKLRRKQEKMKKQDQNSINDRPQNQKLDQETKVEI